MHRLQPLMSLTGYFLIFLVTISQPVANKLSDDATTSFIYFPSSSSSFSTLKSDPGCFIFADNFRCFAHDDKQSLNYWLKLVYLQCICVDLEFKKYFVLFILNINCLSLLHFYPKISSKISSRQFIYNK